jgi:hypothetical protein
MRGKKKEAKKAFDELQKKDPRLANMLDTFFIQNKR